MANTPKIVVNGRELAYWVSVTIDSSIDSLADTFSLRYNVHSQTPPGDANPLTFDGDETVVISLDGEVLLTGYIDSADTDASTEGEVVTLSGYSRTADLVASAVLKTKSYKDQTIEAICKDLCKPFGIEVVVDGSATDAAKTVLTRFKVEWGDTIADALGRAVRYAGLLLFSSPDGGLLLSRTGSERVPTELRHGVNLEQVKVTRDARDRFSVYYVASDGVSGLDSDDADKDDGRVAQAADPGVNRYRPTVISTEQDVKAQAQRRTQAEWERNRRAGLSLHVSCVWTGWRHAGGLWRRNQLVRFVYAKKGIDRDMLVASVSLTREAAGSSVQLELAHPSSFEPRVIPLPRKRKRRGQYADPNAFPTAPNTQFFENTPFAQGELADEELFDDPTLYGDEDVDGEDFIDPM